ncbi:hypothetical protein CCS01_19990 [Rhodopila globiformis]|uniref:Uncharacterized protein n=1 Tax=Rhodopila globiformis TaxID=1071 RepID=A0A2S6N6D1_RHOGL|nr:hypothetical protein CCS01_19990 [Rhodopila globiformis]
MPIGASAAWYHWVPASTNLVSQARIHTDIAVHNRPAADNIRAERSKRAAGSNRPAAVDSRTEARKIRTPAPSRRSRASLRRTSRRRASRRHASLRRASLRRASLRRASLRRASLRRASRPRHRAMLPGHWRWTEAGPKRQPSIDRRSTCGTWSWRALPATGVKPEPYHINLRGVAGYRLDTDHGEVIFGKSAIIIPRSRAGEVHRCGGAPGRRVRLAGSQAYCRARSGPDPGGESGGTAGFACRFRGGVAAGPGAAGRLPGADARSVAVVSGASPVSRLARRLPGFDAAARAGTEPRGGVRRCASSDHVIRPASSKA